MGDDRIPELYETEEISFDRKIIHRRYEIRPIGYYWLIAELDKKRNLAFGYASLNDALVRAGQFSSLNQPSKVKIHCKKV